jgi:formylglycine-generating enzyme required for sulfatase activity
MGGSSGAGGVAGAAGVAAGGSAGTAAGGSAGADAGAFSCTSSGAEPEMVAVPAGHFIMGCNSAVDADCLEDEKPMRSVFVSAFEIDKTEVTQDQYAGCVVAGSCDAPHCAWDCDAKDYAATCVTWTLAKMYCAWAKKRLPTEAEWEKAARGTDGRKYPWGNDEPTCTEANMTGCGEKAKPVGSQPAGASPYGALDMAGNMVEMLEDWYDATYYQSAPISDPKGPASGNRYVGRGGGFKSKAVWQRASSRDWYDTYDQGAALGFRCAR